MEAFGAEQNAPQQAGQKQLLAQELIQAATEFPLYSILALVKLKLWVLLPSFCFGGRGPSLTLLRNIFGINALGSYCRLKNAAGSLGRAYSYDFQQNLLARL